MSELNCQQCRELAAEMALNILPGRERGDTLRHLDKCPPCRQAVNELANVADRLVELIPEARPPAGFEDRAVTVLSAKRDSPRGKREGHLRAAVRGVALLAAVVLVGAGLLGARKNSDPEAGAVSQLGERTVQYAPLVSANRQVGQAYFYPGRPPWIYVSLAAETTSLATDTISCEAIHPDGTTVSLGPIRFDRGRRACAGPATSPPYELVAARLVDQAGDTLATAQFTPQLPSPSPTVTPSPALRRAPAHAAGQPGDQKVDPGRDGDHQAVHAGRGFDKSTREADQASHTSERADHSLGGKVDRHGRAPARVSGPEAAVAVVPRTQPAPGEAARLWRASPRRFDFDGRRGKRDR